MYCRNCGTQLMPGDSFCGSCGASITRNTADQPNASGAGPSQTRRTSPFRLPLMWMLAGLGGVLVLFVLLAVAASALFARETIEPQPGVFTKMPEGWDVVSSSTPDGTARIPDDKWGFGPTLTPEDFSAMSEAETLEYEGPSVELWSALDGSRCETDQETEDFANSQDLSDPSLPFPIESGYSKSIFASRTLDKGTATVAGNDASWSLTYAGSVSPYGGEPGDPNTADYPDYRGELFLGICIEELDLIITSRTAASLADDPTDSEAPTEDRNALLPESREEVNDEIRETFEDNFDVMAVLLEDVDTNGWDGSTDLSDLPTDLDAYDEALADPFGGELEGEMGEVPDATENPETTVPEVVQERTLDVTTVPEETTQAGGLEPGSEERFLYAYYSAASNRDWYFTYQALSDESKGYFTLDEWREVQDARIEQSGGTAPLQDLEILNLIGDAAGATADVELTYEDGTQETITDVGIAVEGSTIQRDLTSDEIAYLQSLLEDGISSNPECGIWGCPDENGEYTSGPPSE